MKKEHLTAVASHLRTMGALHLDGDCFYIPASAEMWVLKTRLYREGRTPNTSIVTTDNGDGFFWASHPETAEKVGGMPTEIPEANYGDVIYKSLGSVSREGLKVTATSDCLFRYFLDYAFVPKGTVITLKPYKADKSVEPDFDLSDWLDY